MTNLEEFDNKTNPYMADTDSDGLTDGDEVKTHGTDPLVADTDGDGLDDGDEIVLGTNPLVQDTDGDGIIDSKEKIQQTFTHKVKNEDCAVTEVIVDMECTGNINRTTSVESVMNVDILCTDVVGLVGEPFEIETTSEFDKATLTFKINKDKLGEIPFDNLLFLWYNEEENRFDELETILDEDHGTVSIVTTHFSKYMVVDRQAWFDNWREIYERFEKLSEKSPSITAICVDCSGSMSTNDPFFYIEQYTKTCYRDLAVQQFVKAMFANDKTSIITFASSAKEVCPLTSDKELLNKNAKFYSSGGTNTNAAINIALQQLVGVYGNKSIILMSDGDVNVSDDNIKKAQTNDIKIHAVALGQGANSSALQKCAEKTYGEFFIVKTAVELKSIYDKLSAENQLNFGNLPDTDGDGVPDDIEISGVPMPGGKLVFLDPTDPDTDGDGLSDGDEVGKLSKNYAPSDVPEYAETYKFSFDVTSDPTSVDSDGDGILDPLDDHPFDVIPPRVKEIIDFFDGAELFEIKYILDKMYVLIEDKDDLDSIEAAIKIIKILREYKGTSNPRGLIQRMLDEGVYGRDGWVAFWDTIFPQMSTPAVWLSEYELYSNGTSFADLMQIAYEQWSSSAKCAAAIWLFGVSSDFGKTLAEYGYSPEYTLSLDQEKSLRRAYDVYITYRNGNIVISDKAIAHLTTVEGFDKKTNGFIGGHTLQSITNANLTPNRPVKIISKVESKNLKGLYKVTYKVGALDNKGNVVGWLEQLYFKTAYDNSIVSDSQMINWAKEAFANGTIEFHTNKRVADSISIKIVGQASNGIKFEGWIDKNTKMIKSFYPLFDD